MPNPLKYFEHGSLYFITSRTEEGLPFKEAHLFSDALDAILARALELYPVDLVAFDLEANHIHILLCAQNPEHVPLFVGYVKQELSHMVNKIRGRQKKTLWCEGYDSPVLLGEEEAMHYITYLYNQNYSSRMMYCNSWQMFTSGKHSKVCQRHYRTHSKDENGTSAPAILNISPFAWLAKLSSSSKATIKAELLRMIARARELKLSGRASSKQKVPTARPLSEVAKPTDDDYVPTKRGRRLYCICWDQEIRASYLSFIEESIAQCREVLDCWRSGNFTVMWPPGFFPPSAIRRANPVFA